MGNFFQRFPYKLRLVLGNDQFHIRRKPGFGILQYFSDFGNGFNRVGIRSQGNGIHDRFTAYALIQEQGSRCIHTFAFVNIGDVF